MPSDEMNNYIDAVRDSTPATTPVEPTAPSRPAPRSSAMSDYADAVHNTSTPTGTDAHLSSVRPETIGTNATTGLENATSTATQTVAAAETGATRAAAASATTAAVETVESGAVQAAKSGRLRTGLTKGWNAVKGGGKWMGKAALIGGGVTAALIAAPTVINWVTGGTKRQPRVSAAELNSDLPPMPAEQLAGGMPQGEQGQWAARIQAEQQQAASSPTLPGGRA